MISQNRSAPAFQDARAIFEVRQFPCLTDNYGFLVHNGHTQETWCVDTPDAERILEELDAAGWQLSAILNTHHHPDHVGGNLAIKSATGCEIIGPEKHASKIPGLDRPVAGGEVLGDGVIDVIDVPGHTRGHVAYWMEEPGYVFVGDVLFPLGCGRLFGGTIEQMAASLERLAALPDETLVFSAHEYATSNLQFALSIEPGNMALRARGEAISMIRSNGEFTVPSTVGEERATNPFLRCHEASLAEALGLQEAPPVDVLAELRRRKDAFA